MAAILRLDESTETSLLQALQVFGMFIGCLLVLTLVLVLIYWMLRASGIGPKRKLTRQVIMLCLTCVTLIVTLLIVGGVTHTLEPIVGLLGLIVTVALTISSTTFTSNAMAGLMLRAVRNFRMGDYVRVGEHFGRVAERGLLHVEIQTEDRDLATLPNVYLVSNPVTVVRASGTIVSTTLSLGYDVPHTQVKKLLEQAATAAELNESFVHVLKLGDFSITYRVAGFLTDVKHLLSARSQLRTCVLDSLHAAGVEIVSPTFMNQRRISDDPIVSHASRESKPKEEPAAEDIMFDKAEEAEQIELQRFQLATLEQEIKDLETRLKEADEASQNDLKAEIERRRINAEQLERKLDTVSLDDAE
jgi:small conductance mechanosensitive channel